MSTTFCFCFQKLLPFFIRGKLETSKIDCEDKISKKPCLFAFSSRKQVKPVRCFTSFVNFYTFSKLQCNDSLIISLQKLRQLITANTGAFQSIKKHNKEVLYKILAKGNWNKLEYRSQLLRALAKTDFLINSEDLQNTVSPDS